MCLNLCSVNNESNPPPPPPNPPKKKKRRLYLLINNKNSFTYSVTNHKGLSSAARYVCFLWTQMQSWGQNYLSLCIYPQTQSLLDCGAWRFLEFKLHIQELQKLYACTPWFQFPSSEEPIVKPGDKNRFNERRRCELRLCWADCVVQRWLMMFV